MDNYSESLGVRVVNMSPGYRENNVNVNANVTVEFNVDIDPSTFSKNIVVLEDSNKIFKNLNSLKDYSQYHAVKGSISYKDRTLTYTPLKPFHTDSCYIVMINDGVKDITGNRMIKKHVFCFYTERIASFPKVEILSPKYGAICESMPEFTWRNQWSESYEFQISKNNTFESLLYNKSLPGNKLELIIKHIPDFQPEEGMYHVRIRSENGEWSDVYQIFIKPITNAVVAEEDVSEFIHLDDFLDGLEEPIEILEYFPFQDSVNISLKINVIYIKIKGRIESEDVRIEDSYVYGESFDEDHEEYAHETVDGKWTVVYDSFYNVTYIIFTPVNLDDVEEKEYIETLRSGRLIEAVNEGGDDDENS